MMKKIYDLTELKRTFVSSKTKLFAVLTIIIFMIVGCLHAQAQNVSLGASIDNIDNLPGQKETNVKAAAISDNSFPEDDKSKIFFIYNVKTGLLLNTGGYWGTHVSLKEFGMPLWVHLDTNDYIHFAQKFDKVGAGAGEGNYMEYENKSKESDPDQGVYVDRSYQAARLSREDGGWKTSVTSLVSIVSIPIYIAVTNSTRAKDTTSSLSTSKVTWTRTAVPWQREAPTSKKHLPAARQVMTNGRLSLTSRSSTYN